MKNNNNKKKKGTVEWKNCNYNNLVVDWKFSSDAH